MADKDTPILETQASRRDVLKTAVYMTPVILTLAAVPSFAAKGSGWKEDKKEQKAAKQEWKAEQKAEKQEQKAEQKAAKQEAKQNPG
jgi:hypothetical protein